MPNSFILYLQMGTNKKGKTVLGADKGNVQNAEDIDIEDVDHEYDSEFTDGEGSSKESRVMYIGQLPFGFFEEEIKKYFSQFGEVRKVRLSRSKKTHHCKGYGWVEFRYPSVAKIAAETMNGYLMFKKRLACHVVDREKIHPELFKGHDQKYMLRPPLDPKNKRYNKYRTSIQKKRYMQRMIAQDKKRKQRLIDFGIDYEYTSFEELFNQKQQRKQKQKEAQQQQEQQAG
eukprot:TRINITY_DN29315_c1_g1_i1.p2 TRINITY_DN29315_c1_g1~~TRINITY_DN29315_c1_g1_i1.p2  ORF type:complete len:248 (-),score=32.31 TRINITY_DN29315_c1_g1_i1:367-1056(-)